ncbi:MAG: hypothetical protein WC344_03760 [Bacilli bacterium]|jgi:hypothetical protein
MGDKALNIPKTVPIRRRGMVCLFLYLSALLAFGFFGLSFLDSFAVASQTLEDAYYSGIELALGVSSLTLNSLLLSCIIVGACGGVFTLVTAIICSASKRYTPTAAMSLAVAIGELAYAFVLSFLFPAIISDSLDALEEAQNLIATTWPIYVMMALLGLALLIDIGLLVYASFDAYASSGTKEINRSR